MTVLLIATDVVREAFARRYMIALFGAIVLFLVGLTFAVDLEVVEGALAAGRLFGANLTDAIVPVDVVMRSVFQVLALFTFYIGLLFGIVASADIAPKMLAPGRVELLLSLPVRRAELVIGTYVGVAVIACVTTAFAVGGVSLVLFWKAELVTFAPAVGAVMAIVGFLPLYGAMLLATSLVRSSALAAGAGIFLYLAGLVTSDREQFLGWFRDGLVRDALGVVISPLPRLGALADAGAAAASGDGVHWALLLPVLGGALAFAGASVTLACFLVSGKDY